MNAPTPVSNTSGPVTINEINSSSVYYTAAPLSSTIIVNMEEALHQKYVKFVVGTTNYCGYYPSADLYDKGILSSITYGNYAGSAYEIILNSSGGFSYNQISNTGKIGTAYKYAASMIDILNEANTVLASSKTDADYYKKVGLYYHFYYAFNYGTGISFGDNNYIAYGVYRLDINSNGQFYWAQSDNPNENYFTPIDGITSTNTSHGDDDRLELYQVQIDFTNDDIGKIYYYTGNAVNDGSAGKNEFFQVVYNSKINSLELKRFGVLGKNFYACSGEGDYNDSYVIGISYPDGNKSDLTILCNLLSYVDQVFLNGGNSGTYFKFGSGGTRQAVFSATITVDGVNYERKFVIDVTGLI